MKKTLVALFALGSMAMAAEIGTTYSFDNVIYDSTGEGTTLSAVDEALSGSTEYINFDQLHHAPSTTLTMGEMLVSDVVDLAAGQRLVLTSVQVVSRNNGQYRPADSVATVTIGGETFTSAAAVYPESTSSRELITFTFDTPIDITADSVVTLSISGDFGYSCYKVSLDHGTGVTLKGDTPTYGEYHMATRLNTMVAPEPATATLSLLALAGLAARRRRH